MTKCPDQKDLQRFADGELKGPRRSRVAAHVKTCPLCAKELQQLRQISELVSGAIRKEVETHDLAGLWQKVSVGIASPPLRRERWQPVFTFLWKPAAKVAYAALIVLFAGLFVVRPLLPGSRRPVALGRAMVYSVDQYDPQVTVSMLMASGDKSAIVWISVVEAPEEN